MSVTFATGQRLTADLLQTLANYTSNRPICKVVQQATQNITNNTDTTIQFGTSSEVIDTNGMHDEVTNNTRLTVPTGYDGWWHLEGTLFMGGAGAAITYVLLQGGFLLNSGIQTPRNRSGFGPNQTNVSATAYASTMVQASAGDYFEFVCQQIASTTSTRATNVGGSFASTFTAEFVRPN